MARNAWASRVRHDSDATFREWGSEVAAKLLAIGLTHTSDSGQINWATVLRPGANTDAGYEVWNFNDSQQSGAPIYFRIDYGTGTSVTNPRMKLTVGTGSNGSGTITGTALAAAQIITSGGAEGTDTLRNSWICYVDGFLGLAWKSGATVYTALFIARTVDTTGVADTVGCYRVSSAASAALLHAQRLRFASPAAANTDQTTVVAASICHWPNGVTASAVGSDLQVSIPWAMMPRNSPFVGFVGVLPAEFAEGNQFSFTAVGSTPRNYIALSGQTTHMDANAQLKPAMLWEV